MSADEQKRPLIKHCETSKTNYVPPFKDNFCTSFLFLKLNLNKNEADSIPLHANSSYLGNCE